MHVLVEIACSRLRSIGLAAAQGQRVERERKRRWATASDSIHLSRLTSINGYIFTGNQFTIKSHLSLNPSSLAISLTFSSWSSDLSSWSSLSPSFSLTLLPSSVISHPVQIIITIIHSLHRLIVFPFSREYCICIWKISETVSERMTILEERDCRAVQFPMIDERAESWDHEYDLPILDPRMSVRERESERKVSQKVRASERVRK